MAHELCANIRVVAKADGSGDDPFVGDPVEHARPFGRRVHEEETQQRDRQLPDQSAAANGHEEPNRQHGKAVVLQFVHDIPAAHDAAEQPDRFAQFRNVVDRHVFGGHHDHVHNHDARKANKSVPQKAVHLPIQLHAFLPRFPPKMI